MAAFRHLIILNIDKIILIMTKNTSPSWSDIKKSITDLDYSQLVALIKDLFNFSEGNRTFLKTRFSPGGDPLKTYKTIIRDNMYPDFRKNQDFSIADAKKAISDYSRAAGDPIDKIELMVYFTECGNKSAVELGDLYEQFYDSICSVYRQVIKKIVLLPEPLKSDYKKRLKFLVTSSEGMGWGYHDELGDIFYDAFPDEIDD